MHTEF